MIKQCEYCGEEFETHIRNKRICDGIHTAICPICGKEREITKSQAMDILKRGPVTCSYECRVKKTQATSMKKYGCKAPGNNPEARRKASETMMEHLGVPYAMMNKDVQEKSKITLIDRLGVDNAGKNKEVIQKRMNTNKERYGDVMPFNRPECYEKQHNTIQKKYGVRYASLIPHVAQHNNHVSKFNLDFKKKLEVTGLTVSTEKVIENLLYDLHIEGQHQVIEVNPTYTHNLLGNHWNSKGLDKYYHRDKTQLAADKGFRCIHVWDWDDKEKIVEYLRPREKHDASEFEVYRLSNEATKEFLTKYHVLGSHRGQVLSLGLVKDNEIYQIMTFCKSKYDKNYFVQLCRWGTRPGYEIIGGYDKLSKCASEQFEIYKVIAYVDRSKFDGSDLEEIGMKLIRTTPPRKIWSKGKEFINDSLVISGKSKYHSKEELLQDGWLPVYDCGQLVYATE